MYIKKHLSIYLDSCIHILHILYLIYILYVYLIYLSYISLDKIKKEWFHPGSIRGPSPRQDDVITNYTMKPFK